MTGRSEHGLHLIRVSLLFVVVGLLTGIAVRTAHAQEKWCADNPAYCVCSEPLTAQSYTMQPGGYLSADDYNAMKCSWGGNYGWSIWAPYGPAPFRQADAGILNLMPRRDTSIVTSYLGSSDGAVSSWMVGGENAAVANAARVVFRFYVYRSPNFEFANESACTNGKTAEVIGAGFQGAELIFTSSGYINKVYGFVNGTWAWNGAWNFDGWTHGPDGFDGDPGSHWTLGKWIRHEIVVKWPNSRSGWTDAEWYMTDVTNGGPTLQVFKMSNPCVNCIGIDGSLGTWAPDGSARPLTDLVDYAVNMYRAGDCAGWSAVSHVALAAFPTDEGQMIGPAVEVEGPR